jgi:hypothetical protein
MNVQYCDKPNSDDTVFTSAVLITNLLLFLQHSVCCRQLQAAAAVVMYHIGTGSLSSHL